MKTYNDILLEAISKLTKPEDEEIDEAIDFSNRAPRPVAPVVRKKENVFVSPMMKGPIARPRPTDAWAGNRAAGLGESEESLNESKKDFAKRIFNSFDKYTKKKYDTDDKLKRNFKTNPYLSDEDKVKRIDKLRDEIRKETNRNTDRNKERLKKYLTRKGEWEKDKKRMTIGAGVVGAAIGGYALYKVLKKRKCKKACDEIKDSEKKKECLAKC